MERTLFNVPAPEKMNTEPSETGASGAGAISRRRETERDRPDRTVPFGCSTLACGSGKTGVSNAWGRDVVIQLATRSGE
jgi:hypothetical protein